MKSISSAAAEALFHELSSEIRHYDLLVRSHLDQIYKMLLLAFTIGVSLASVVLSLGKNDLLLFAPIIPFSIFIAFTIGLRLMAEMFALAAHKFYLEEQRSQLIVFQYSKAVALPAWDSGGGRVVSYSLVNMLIMSLYLSLLLAIGVIVATAMWTFYPEYRWVAAGTGVITPILVAVLGICFIRVRNFYERTLEKLRCL